MAKPLTQEIGTAERLLQAVLQRHLTQAGISFADWAALMLLAGLAPCTRGDLEQAMTAGSIAQGADVLSGLQARGWIEDAAAGLRISLDGEAVFMPLRAAVMAASARLFADLPEADLAATRLVLDVVAERARAMLA